LRNEKCSGGGGCESKRKRGRGESLSLFEAPATAIGNANPPSTFQLKSSKFTCNYQLGAAHVRGAPKSPDRKKGGRKLFAFQAPHEGLFALPLVVIDV